MFSNQQQLLLVLVLGLVLYISAVSAEKKDLAEAEVIKDDVIRDEIENKTQKVIRVSTLDLPSKKDHTGNNMNSALIQVQTLRPGTQRKYVDSKRMRRPRPAPITGEEVPVLKYTPELKPFPKQKKKQQKQLHFLFDQPTGIEGIGTSRALPVEVAPGAYPVYYVVSKTNGRFGKFPIKAFSKASDFTKYLIKSKAEPVPREQRFERFR